MDNLTPEIGNADWTTYILATNILHIDCIKWNVAHLFSLKPRNSESERRVILSMSRLGFASSLTRIRRVVTHGTASLLTGSWLSNSLSDLDHLLSPSRHFSPVSFLLSLFLSRVTSISNSQPFPSADMLCDPGHEKDDESLVILRRLPTRNKARHRSRVCGDGTPVSALPTNRGITEP